MNQASINQGDVGETAIPLAPAQEQERILELIVNALESLSAMETGLASSEAELTQLDQSILAKAFRGELVPQDPRDEPASQLLHHIRATREKLEADQKTKKKANKKKKANIKKKK